MAFETLISVADLERLLSQAKDTLVIDCSFDLGDAEAGFRRYVAGHIPGALYLHLEKDLSGPTTGSNGRHPLPEQATFVARMAGLGAGDDTQIVAYDNSGGMYAARLWWMMRWIGHKAVAVLDGGSNAWSASGLPMTAAATPARRAGTSSLRAPLVRAVSHAAVRSNLSSGELLLIDARAPDRFRGENETIDPVGGHIPGARNRLFRDNLDASGHFKKPAELRQAFEALVGSRPATTLVSQCGSGVTACHNLLALEIAGMAGAALYPGSWSEWCTQPGAPIATGPDH